MAERWQRNPAINETVVEDEMFLVEPDSQEVFYLDRISSGLWRALAEPQDEAGLVALFATAFPGTPRATIARDIAAALTELKRRKLVVSVP